VRGVGADKECRQSKQKGDTGSHKQPLEVISQADAAFTSPRLQPKSGLADLGLETGPKADKSAVD